MSETNITGVFVLQEVRERILADLWPKDFYVRSQNNYGWYGGGQQPSTTYYSTVDRITFSSDTTTASIRGSLTIARPFLTSTGNDNYGWFGGGGIPGTDYTRVDRITYSSDTATTTARGNLGNGRDGMASTGNNNFGWFAGGMPGFTDIYRIDFSTDSSAASSRGPLTWPRGYLAATGAEKNTNFGWFTGASQTIPAPSTGSLIDRITFNSDTVAASVRGNLSTTRNLLSARSNSQYGWFFGGDFNNGGAFSIVDRITFASDTSTASVRGPLSLNRSIAAASGNDSDTWISGGYYYPSPGTIIYLSNTDRVTYSSDTATATIRGNLSSTRWSLSATSGVL